MPSPRPAFDAALAAAQPAASRSRAWLFVPDDQLSADIGPLAERPAGSVGIVLVESGARARARPYHRQRLALCWANQRHFALEQARRGVAVRYVVTESGTGAALAALRDELGELCCMQPAALELARDVAPHVRMVPHGGWLSEEADFDRLGEPPWRMDVFYRHMRKRTGWLMDGANAPAGGRWSHDSDNRQPYRGEPSAPRLPRFVADEVTRELAAEVMAGFAEHHGEIDVGALPVTQAHAERVWAWAKRECLVHFGPFEDAMAAGHSNLFHTRLSALINMHRLLPAHVVTEALALDLPLASKEGFVRQILGWREFVRHVYRVTDGLRRLPTDNFLAAEQPLPAAYYYTPSGLNCLDSVVADVWREAHSHHITRLMVLCNLATLIAIEPRAVSDWFWIAYDDSYDWVVEPNVLGMGTYALGDVMTTKPYISGAGYIHRMSDYCRDCAFHPTKTCPITPMYWAFLAHHAERLAGNRRLQVPLASLKRRAPERQALDRKVLAWVQETLRRGERLEPGVRPLA